METQLRTRMSHLAASTSQPHDLHDRRSLPTASGIGSSTAYQNHSVASIYSKMQQINRHCEVKEQP